MMDRWPSALPCLTSVLFPKFVFVCPAKSSVSFTDWHPFFFVLCMKLNLSNWPSSFTFKSKLPLFSLFKWLDVLDYLLSTTSSAYPESAQTSALTATSAAQAGLRWRGGAWTPAGRYKPMRTTVRCDRHRLPTCCFLSRNYLVRMKHDCTIGETSAGLLSCSCSGMSWQEDSLWGRT